MPARLLLDLGKHRTWELGLWLLFSELPGDFHVQAWPTTPHAVQERKCKWLLRSGNYHDRNARPFLRAQRGWRRQENTNNNISIW